MAALKCDDGAVGTWPGQWGAASRVCFGDPPRLPRPRPCAVPASERLLVFSTETRRREPSH